MAVDIGLLVVEVVVFMLHQTLVVLVEVLEDLLPEVEMLVMVLMGIMVQMRCQILVVVVAVLQTDQYRRVQPFGLVVMAVPESSSSHILHK